MGEERGTPDRTDELITELRERVRSLEYHLRQEREANRETRRILASLAGRIPELPVALEAGRTEPAKRRIRSWWKEKYGAAMVGVITAFAVLAASGGENPLRAGGEEEQARAVPVATEPAPPNPTTQPVPAPEPVPSSEPVSTEPVDDGESFDPSPAPTDPVRPAQPVREPDTPPS